MKRTQKMTLKWEEADGKTYKMVMPSFVAWTAAHAISRDRGELVKLEGEYGEGMVRPNGTSWAKWGNDFKEYETVVHACI